MKRRAGSDSRFERLRVLPWAAAARAFIVVGKRWRALSPKERARLGRLARDSQGRLSKLSRGERAELRSLVRKLDLAGMGRDLVSLARGGGKGRRRRRRR